MVLLPPQECNTKSDECSDCISWSVFKRINDGIDRVVNQYTLYDLIKERKEGSENDERSVSGLFGYNPCKTRVLEAMLPYFTQEFGNPSSLYKIGTRNKDAITKARKQVADLIGASEKELYFTSGGSESDNWAIGAAQLRKQKEIMLSHRK